MVSVKIFKFSVSLFFFKIGLNILFDYLQDRKQPFIEYTNNIIKKSKNWDFGQNFQIFFQIVFL